MSKEVKELTHKEWQLTHKEWQLFSDKQKIAYIIENGGDDKYGINKAIKIVREYNTDRIRVKAETNSNEVIKCPCCNSTLGYQEHSLDAGIQEFIWVLVNLSLQEIEKIDLQKYGVTLDYMIDNGYMPSFHFIDNDKNGDGNRGVIDVIYKSTCDVNGANGRKPLGYSPLKHWSFMEGDSRHRNPIVLGRGKTNGFQVPLRNAFDFCLNNKPFPKECRTLNDEVIWWSKELVYFKDCKLIPYNDRQKFRTTY